MSDNLKVQLELLKIDEINKLHFNSFIEPQVSIIIPVFNNWKYTYCCLNSILEHTEEVTYEVIVVDDGSSDETVEMLEKVENIKKVRNESNIGYIWACNEGARNAQGTHLLFLNNDTTVTKGWLKAMVDLMDSNKTIGAVGPKLIFPDGTLQEAGCIIWMDGSVLRYGRGKDPGNPEFCYTKEVDYCSGACLLVRKDIFFNLGGFDEIYSPAYYEDSDLCLEIKKLGYKVVYQPDAQIIHHEFGGSSNEKALALYLNNMPKFVKKWTDVLKNQLPPYSENILLARDSRKGKRILALGDRIPQSHLGSAFHRTYIILKYLSELGYVVTFFPLSDTIAYQPYTRELQSSGIEVFYGENLNIEGFIKERSNFYDAIFISKSHSAAKYLQILRESFRDALIIYDVDDPEAFYPLKGLDKDKLDETKFTQIKETELLNYVDAILVFSESDRRKIIEMGFKNIFVWEYPLDGKISQLLFEEMKLRLARFLKGEFNKCLDKQIRSQVIDSKERYIQDLHAKISTMEDYIKSLKDTTDEKGQQIFSLQSHLDTIIKEKDEYIESLKEVIGSKDKYIKDFETTLESKVNEILKLQNYIESMIKEKDQYIESLKEAMDSKDKYIKDFETTLESKVNEILKLQNYIESMIKEKDQYIESLKEAMDSKDKYAKDLERNLESIVPEKDKYIESLLNALDGKAKEVADLNTSIVQKNEDIERLNSELNALKNMYIYRLLKKFKFVKMSPTDLKNN